AEGHRESPGDGRCQPPGCACESPRCASAADGAAGWSGSGQRRAGRRARDARSSRPRPCRARRERARTASRYPPRAAPADRLAGAGQDLRRVRRHCATRRLARAAAGHTVAAGGGHQPTGRAGPGTTLLRPACAAVTTLVFTAPGWQWIAVVATAAAVVLASLEWRRSGPRRALRAALVAVAVLALGVIGMRPARSRPISDATSLVIVTANRGAPDRQTKAQAAAIADSLQAALILRDTIPDLAWLRRRQPAIDTLHVVGAGLDAADRRAASGLTVRVHPVTPQRGLVQLAWTR